MTGMILIDLQTAFDTIDHVIVLKKLRAIGVNLGNCYSDPSNITCGIPQGSILGHLLFLIYVSDIPQAVKSNPFLYADERALFFRERML